MKTKLQRLLTLVLALTLTCSLFTTPVNASPAPNGSVESILAESDPYVDFSSDRSTWFFDLDGTGEVVFCDFFCPFDPYSKVKAYDPLVMHRLENAYQVSGTEDDRAVTLSLNDLEKLYDPYFAFAFEPAGNSEADGTLYIRYTLYRKLELDGFGVQSTRLLYFKTIWDVVLPVKDGKANAGTCTVTNYDPALGGRNLSDFNIDPNTAHVESTPFTLMSEVVLKNGRWYVPANQLMALMGKDCFESEGYLHIQTKDLVDVTVEMSLEERLPLAMKYISGFSEDNWKGIKIPEVVVPDASNPWHCGWSEEFDESYTWADYMDDVADGSRNRGWLWRTFYLSSDDEYKDLNGETVKLEANRIVPFNMYVPHGYDKDNTRLVYMLHGGTGSENTATFRAMSWEDNPIKVDLIADEYNYIIVSPNGWTQNPMWREKQAFKSILKAGDMAMEEFPVDENKVFLTGNSMGGKGVFEVAMRMPERFRAIAPTAAKIAEQVKVNGVNKNVCNLIESDVYSVEKNLADMPVLMVQGSADTTTSHKVQIGSSIFEGMITTYVMPYLNNARYVTVESGSHTHSYGPALYAIFDFFESQLDPYEENYSFETLALPEKGGDTVFLDGNAYTLDVPTQVVDGTVMIAVSQLEKLYGEDFHCYYIENYDKDPVQMRKYYTIIHENSVLNFVTKEAANPVTDPEENLTLYRRNMERYLEDGVKRTTFLLNPEPLRKQPRFPVAPFEADGEIYLPAVEALAALSERAEILGEWTEYTKSEATINGVVTLTIQPASIEYTVGGVLVTDAKGKTLPVSRKGDAYEFTAPTGGYSITPLFARVVDFADVTYGDQHYESVEYTFTNGLLIGTGGGNFSPEVSATRGMVMTVLARLDGLNTGTGADWYDVGMKWGAEANLFDGTGPWNEVTIEELLTILWRYAKFKGYDTSASLPLTVFTDGDSASDYASEALSWACREGLYLGAGDGRLLPQQTVTRAQMADILMRFSRGY